MTRTTILKDLNGFIYQGIQAGTNVLNGTANRVTLAGEGQRLIERFDRESNERPNHLGQTLVAIGRAFLVTATSTVPLCYSGLENAVSDLHVLADEMERLLASISEEHWA